MQRKIRNARRPFNTRRVNSAQEPASSPAMGSDGKEALEEHPMSDYIPALFARAALEPQALDLHTLMAVVETKALHRYDGHLAIQRGPLGWSVRFEVPDGTPQTKPAHLTLAHALLYAILAECLEE
jgi:hypothetical protein